MMPCQLGVKASRTKLLRILGCSAVIHEAAADGLGETWGMPCTTSAWSDSDLKLYSIST